jgi:NADPH:quinone reductase-like Zn-dependent oxidoreductase
MPTDERANRRLTFYDYGGPDMLRVAADPDLPAPGPGEALIRVAASSLCFTDMLIRRNLYPLRKTRPGETLGYDFVGRVAALGPGATGPEPGTMVAALTQVGGGQDWLCHPVDALVTVPEGLDPITVEPLILSYLTAYQCLTRLASLEPGARILVVGASGAVGLAALDLAHAMGIQATGIASARRSDLIRAMGARFIAYDASEQTGGTEGYALILDGAGVDGIGRHLRRLGPGGRYVGFGFTGHLRRAGAAALGGARLLGQLRLALSYLNFKVQETLGRPVSFYDISAMRRAHPDWFRADLTTLLGMLAENKIAPHIDGVFPPERAAEAHALIEAGQVTGRLVLDLRQPELRLDVARARI